MELDKDRIIIKMKFGSHLYGTDTPESDLDIKGVFLPTREQILLGRVPKTMNLSTNKTDQKNSKDDVDEEYYSLPYFIELALKGETVALDMLHAPREMWYAKDSPMIDIWLELYWKRTDFHTKNLKAFVGYARKQASKYGVKGSRLSDAKRVLDFMEEYNQEDNFKLRDLWDFLPEGEHIFKHEADCMNNNLRVYEVCGRKLQETASVLYTMGVIQKFYDNYGHRALLASKNEGVDWKAVSHAIRAGLQVREILLHDTITFPLKKAEFIKEVKSGKLGYLEGVAPYLDNIIDQVEELSLVSKLPEKADRVMWEDWICNNLEEKVFENGE